MSYTKQIRLNPASIISLLIPILFFSCTSIVPRNYDYVSTLQLDQKDDSPKSVVIMPFDNETTEMGIEILTRKSFYNHFSSKNYRDIELSAVDRGLEILGSGGTKTWRDLSPSSIGKHFHADYIIYGRIKEFKKVFLGIYSQILLTVELEMLDSENGNLVWGRTVTSRSHEGGLPFNLFSILPAALRSGFHMKDEKTIELADKVNRDLTERIPEPPRPPAILHFIEIQVVSFLENERAQRTLKEFKGKGFNPRIETVTLVDKLWHRIMLGPYYNLPEAEEVRDRITRDTQFRPLFIHHYPETSEKESLKN
ncbi:GNA1162 family protein [Thermodesulfobacteriota bacterium]